MASVRAHPIRIVLYNADTGTIIAELLPSDIVSFTISQEFPQYGPPERKLVELSFLAADLGPLEEERRITGSPKLIGE